MLLRDTLSEGSVKVTLEDVLVLLVDVLKDLRGQAEVLRDHSLGCMLEPFAQQEGGVFGETAVIEHE